MTIIATKDELKSVAEDTETNLNELRMAINSHAASLNLHRYLLEKFIPAGLLEQACNEWYAAQQQAIADEQAKAEGHGPAAEA